MDKKQVNHILKFSTNICGDSWQIKLYTFNGFEALYPDTLAITHYRHKKNIRTISFRGPTVSKDTIAHELLHAYLSYHDFSKKRYGIIEEKICEVIGKKYKHIHNLTHMIHDKFKRFKRCQK